MARRRLLGDDLWARPSIRSRTSESSSVATRSRARTYRGSPPSEATQVASASRWACSTCAFLAACSRRARCHPTPSSPTWRASLACRQRRSTTGCAARDETRRGHLTELMRAGGHAALSRAAAIELRADLTDAALGMFEKLMASLGRAAERKADERAARSMREVQADLRTLAAAGQPDAPRRSRRLAGRS